MKAQNFIGTKHKSPFPHYTVTKNNFSVKDELSQVLDSLIGLVEKQTGITARQMKGGTRPYPIALARQIYYAITAEVLKPSFDSVFTYDFVTSKMEQDHVTMISAVARHKKCMEAFSEGISKAEIKNAAYKRLYNETIEKFVLLINPASDENFLARRITIVSKINDLREHLGYIDAELKLRGYEITDGNAVKKYPQQ